MRQVVIYLQPTTSELVQDLRSNDWSLRAKRSAAKQSRQDCDCFALLAMTNIRYLCVSPVVQQTAFVLESTRHEFGVIRLWEQKSDIFLNTPGLLPFATLSQTSDKTRTLQQVAQATLANQRYSNTK